MHEGQEFARGARWARVARLSAEYAIAIGVAILCGYEIVVWRW